MQRIKNTKQYQRQQKNNKYPPFPNTKTIKTTKNNKTYTDIKTNINKEARKQKKKQTSK